MSKKRKILIVGGGSAGWTTAALLVRTLPDNYEIEILESNQIGTVGVGEGATPKMALLFKALGIDESEWMPACNATYKVGVEFKDWSVKPGFESYFHGFYSHFDRDHLKALKFNSVLRRSGVDVHANPDLFVYNAYLAEKRLSPVTPYSFPFDVQYAYHFDATLLGEFLKKYSMKHGVLWRDCRVVGTERRDDGGLASVVTETGEKIEADLFFDCTGFGALLIEKELGAKHISYSNALFNDAAVAISTDAELNPKPQTTATAMRSGWAWQIPLQNRTGNGYVYSSRYCEADQAEAELRSHLGKPDEEIEAKHLKMRLGRLEKTWVRNCVAVGLSQGFIEPVEATGLALVQYTITRFLDYYLKNGENDEVRKAFNEELGTAFDGVKDFIVAHYLTASREDTPYWKDVSENSHALSSNLKAVFQSWYSSDNFDDVLTRRKITQQFSINSWYYLMSGKGIFPDNIDIPPKDEYLRKVPVEEISDFLTRCSLNHSTHSEQLDKLRNSEIYSGSNSNASTALDVLVSAMPQGGSSMFGLG